MLAVYELLHQGAFLGLSGDLTIETGRQYAVENRPKVQTRAHLFHHRLSWIVCLYAASLSRARLFIPDGQYWAGRVTHDFLCDAPQEDVLETGVPMRRHHNKVRGELCRHMDNGGGVPDSYLYVPQSCQGRRHQIPQSREGFFIVVTPERFRGGRRERR